MSAATVWTLFVAMGVITWALRASFLLLPEHATLPAWLRRALVYVPPAVLAAIVAPALFSAGGVTVGPVDARLPAALIAIAVAFRTRSVVATLGVGMGALWLFGWLGGGLG